MSEHETWTCPNIRCRRHNDLGDGGICTHCGALHAANVSETPDAMASLMLPERLGCLLADVDGTYATKNPRWRPE
jgi:hypothetical protein